MLALNPLFLTLDALLLTLDALFLAPARLWLAHAGLADSALLLTLLAHCAALLTFGRAYLRLWRAVEGAAGLHVAAPVLAPVAAVLTAILPQVLPILAPVLTDILPVVAAEIAAVFAAILADVLADVLAVAAPLLLVAPTLLAPILAISVLHRKAASAGAIVEPGAVTGIIEVVVIAAAIADLAKAEPGIAAVEAVIGRIAVAIGVIATGIAAAADPDGDTAIAAIIAHAIGAGGQRDRAQRDGGDTDGLAAIVLED